MNGLEYGEIRVELVQEMRALGKHDADVPDLVELLLKRLGLSSERALFPVLSYFRAAFCLSLREALPLREWLAWKDRSEIDSILIPALKRTKSRWESSQVPADAHESVALRSV